MQGEIQDDGLVHNRKRFGVNVIEVSEANGARLISSAIDIPMSLQVSVDDQVSVRNWIHTQYQSLVETKIKPLSYIQ